MNISIITVFPELHETFINTSLIKKAIDKGTLTCNLIRFSDLCPPKVRIDEPTCGPGAGMIIKPELIEHAIAHCEEQFGKGIKIFFSPQGTTLTQPLARALAHKIFSPLVENNIALSTSNKHEAAQGHLILVCTRYEGIDERVEQVYADYTISIGDYVLMGGDLPAQVFLECILRLLPGIVGNKESVTEESFSGCFLDHPQYGLPLVWKGKEIPPVILSGNHQKIGTWRRQQSAQKTVLQRFDWLRSQQLTAEEKKLAEECIPSHHMAVMHTDIMLKGGEIGTTSIASLDIHDIARAATTYNIKSFFIASPLKDQQDIVSTFLDFWRSPEGIAYNESRYRALRGVKLVESFKQIIDTITLQEGKRPVIIATSARPQKDIRLIDYQSQGLVWQLGRPVLIVFGTGQGLAPTIMDQSDFLLLPVEGFSSYRHLSVRSAVAIVLDRWLGLQQRLVILPEKNGY